MPSTASVLCTEMERDRVAVKEEPLHKSKQASVLLTAPVAGDGLMLMSLTFLWCFYSLSDAKYVPDLF